MADHWNFPTSRKSNSYVRTYLYKIYYAHSWHKIAQPQAEVESPWGQAQVARRWARLSDTAQDFLSIAQTRLFFVGIWLCSEASAVRVCFQQTPKFSLAVGAKLWEKTDTSQGGSARAVGGQQRGVGVLAHFSGGIFLFLTKADHECSVLAHLQR